MAVQWMDLLPQYSVYYQHHLNVVDNQSMCDDLPKFNHNDTLTGSKSVSHSPIDFVDLISIQIGSILMTKKSTSKFSARSLVVKNNRSIFWRNSAEIGRKSQPSHG
ncbi:hypothetical protein DERF_010874 [Dermatophagoides farinae]|uniref:Uncharacterized protein n=1 Tax=Dermatophagoides farinae TaxID=6954 RepID=A0A922HRW5_DERFA|nr:hypothetical protein DERF_010874 [Dermatophagoides farinae]